MIRVSRLRRAISLARGAVADAAASTARRDAQRAEVRPAELKVDSVPPPLDPPDEWDDAPLYQARRKIYPQRVHGTLPPHQMGGAVRHARHLLLHAVPALGSRPERARPGGADRSAEPALLLLLHRDLAAGDLLPHRPADHRRDDAVPDERARRAHLVRLSLPADGVDRPVPDDRALDRRRPARAHAARARRLDARARRARGRRSISSG